MCELPGLQDSRRRFVAAAIGEYSKPATRTWGRDARPAVLLSQCQHEQPVRSLLAEFADSKMLLDSGAQASGHRLRRSRGRTQSSRGGKCFDPPRACLQKPTRRVVLLRFEEEEEGDPPLLARAGKISPLQGVKTRIRSAPRCRLSAAAAARSIGVQGKSRAWDGSNRAGAGRCVVVRFHVVNGAVQKAKAGA